MMPKKTKRCQSAVETSQNKRVCRESLPTPPQQQAVVAPRPSPTPTFAAPTGFSCPLTHEIMFDPVLDAEGNTYERYALLQWLQEHRTSPISRQPLSEKMLVPNNALRETIHQIMGPAWVQRATLESEMRKQQQLLQEQLKLQKQMLLAKSQQQQVEKLQGTANPSVPSSPNTNTDTNTDTNNINPPKPRTMSPARRKINTFLQFAAQDMGFGLALQLNDKGCAAFRMEDTTVVIDVPEKGESFCLYTRNMLLKLTEPMKDLLLELNFLQGDTRGGCLSVRKPDEDKDRKAGFSEVMFSYTDRVAEVSARDFVNIVLNFLETAVSLRKKLLAVADKETKNETKNQNDNNQTTTTEASSTTTTSSDKGETDTATGQSQPQP